MQCVVHIGLIEVCSRHVVLFYLRVSLYGSIGYLKADHNYFVADEFSSPMQFEGKVAQLSEGREHQCTLTSKNTAVSCNEEYHKKL